MAFSRPTGFFATLTASSPDRNRVRTRIAVRTRSIMFLRVGACLRWAPKNESWDPERLLWHLPEKITGFSTAASSAWLRLYLSRPSRTTSRHDTRRKGRGESQREFLYRLRKPQCPANGIALGKRSKHSMRPSGMAHSARLEAGDGKLAAHLRKHPTDPLHADRRGDRGARRIGMGDSLRKSQQFSGRAERRCDDSYN